MSSAAVFAWFPSASPPPQLPRARARRSPLSARALRRRPASSVAPSPRRVVAPIAVAVGVHRRSSSDAASRPTRRAVRRRRRALPSPPRALHRRRHRRRAAPSIAGVVRRLASIAASRPAAAAPLASPAVVTAPSPSASSLRAFISRPKPPRRRTSVHRRSTRAAVTPSSSPPPRARSAVTSIRCPSLARRRSPRITVVVRPSPAASPPLARRVARQRSRRVASLAPPPRARRQRLPLPPYFLPLHKARPNPLLPTHSSISSFARRP